MRPLPIDDVLPEILDALAASPALVLRAPTGAGKTTRVPPAILDAGLAGGRRVEASCAMLEAERLTMPLSAQDVYTKAVRSLSPTERLRLAALILNELIGRATPAGPVDLSDVWTDEDQRDLASFSLQYAATVYPEDEDLVA